jgi:hypothetical protein
LEGQEAVIRALLTRFAVAGDPVVEPIPIYQTVDVRFAVTENNWGIGSSVSETTSSRNGLVNLGRPQTEVPEVSAVHVVCKGTGDT